MTWSFDRAEYKVYKRNTLISTDVEILFHPILKIGDPACLSKYQDQIRRQFPRYNQSNVRAISFNSTGNFEVQDQLQHTFSDVDEGNSIILTPKSFRVSNTKHIQKESMINTFVDGLVKLESTLEQVNAYRIGMRYINIIDKHQVSTDLGKDLGWGDLISGEFLKMPHEIADTADTNFVTEVRSSLEKGEGGLTLRYGLMQNHENSPDHFRFDIDRFIDIDENIDNLPNLLNEFAMDIYSLFETVVGTELRRWMGGK